MKKDIEEITNELVKSKGYKRFNKKKFTELVNYVASDTDFISEVIKIKKGTIAGTKEIPISKNLRKWVKDSVTKMGVDPSEASIIMSDDFELPSMDWMYDFIAEVIYIYLKMGNRFELPKKEKFSGSIYLKEYPITERTRRQVNPVTGEVTGPYKIIKKEHDELKVKSVCPKYLTIKEKT